MPGTNNWLEIVSKKMRLFVGVFAFKPKFIHKMYKAMNECRTTTQQEKNTEMKRMGYRLINCIIYSAFQLLNEFYLLLIHILWAEKTFQFFFFVERIAVMLNLFNFQIAIKAMPGRKRSEYNTHFQIIYITQTIIIDSFITGASYCDY